MTRTDRDGSPPALVAVAGTLCSPAVYDPLARCLGEAVTVDAVSWMTGDGPWDIASVAAATARHVRDTHRGPVLLAGHSTGGAIALQLALRHPELVAGLMLVNTGATMRGHGDVDTILDALARDRRATTAAILDRSFAHPLDAAVRAELLGYADAVPLRAALEVLTSQRDLDLTDRLGELDLPATVVHGVRDPVRSLDRARALAAALPAWAA